MFRKFDLKPHNGVGPSLEFEWDPDTGVVRGRDAGLVRAMAARAAAQGTVLIDPYPTVYELHGDPLRNPEGMAAMLGYEYRLDEVLEAAYPAMTESDLPPGAIA